MTEKELLGPMEMADAAGILILLAVAICGYVFLRSRLAYNNKNIVSLIRNAQYYRRGNNWEEALAAYQMAVQLFDRFTEPKVKGDCYHGIAYCQYQLGKAEAEPNLFFQSNAMNERAWNEYAPAGHGYEAMVTLSHIGNTLMKLSKHENAEKHLINAISMYHATLSQKTEAQIREVQWGNWSAIENEGTDEYEDDEDREIEEMLGGRYPVEHGNILNNLGSAYRQLAPLSDSELNLKNSIKYYNEALKIRSLERFPEEYAVTMMSLGNTHIDLYRIRKDPEDLTIAAHEFTQALTVYTGEDFPDIHRSLLKRRDRVLKKLVKLQSAG